MGEGVMDRDELSAYLRWLLGICYIGMGRILGMGPCRNCRSITLAVYDNITAYFSNV